MKIIKKSALVIVVLAVVLAAVSEDSTAEPIELSMTAASGQKQYNIGDEVSVLINSNTDGYINCYFQRKDAYVRVFPNRFSADGYISANQEISLPDAETYSFIADEVQEKIHCYLSVQKIDNALPASLQIADLKVLPIGSLDIVTQAYKEITNQQFGQASFAINTQ